MTPTQPLNYVIPTLFGLEGICANELRRLGLEQVRGENGRVLCQGGPEQIARLNLNIRTGERVLIELGRFRAENFDDLFEGVRVLPWEDWIPREGKFPVKGYCINSVLHAESACQSIIKKAVARRLGEKYRLNILPESGELVQIQFSLMKDEAVLMLDTSGAGLYKRGYRAVGVAAPLRETLAAAMVILSRYRGRDAFRDPFCGSGTIPIEAALIALNRAPGLNRRFAAQQWRTLDRSIWKEAVEESRAKEFCGEYNIIGTDIDPKAIEIARSNAKKAGVSHLIHFETADALAFHETQERGRIVTNPPYGERLMEKREAEALYRGFGKAYAELSKSWELYLLSSHTEFERTFGKEADQKRKLYNGMIKCDLFMYRSNGGYKRDEKHKKMP